MGRETVGGHSELPARSGGAREEPLAAVGLVHRGGQLWTCAEERRGDAVVGMALRPPGQMDRRRFNADAAASMRVGGRSVAPSLIGMNASGGFGRFRERSRRQNQPMMLVYFSVTERHYRKTQTSTVYV